jgi:hypothetical protein
MEEIVLLRLYLRSPAASMNVILDANTRSLRGNRAIAEKTEYLETSFRISFQTSSVRPQLHHAGRRLLPLPGLWPGNLAM